MACLSGPMLGIGLTGCTVGPDYQSPEMREAPRRSASDGGSVPSRTVERPVDIAWWKSFRDLQLSSLVERLVAQNLDLETAAERVIQSMAQRRVAFSQGLPQIDGQSCRGFRARFRWACPDRWCAAGRTCARPRRDCMKPRRRPASRWRASILK